MRGRYKEYLTICRNKYIDLDIIPEFKQAKGHRHKRYRTTRKVQKLYNERARRRAVTQLINHNFTENDIFATLTYSDEHLPENEKQAKRDRENFIRRLRRFCKANNLPELKYIVCTERSERTGRLHHHIIINGSGILFEHICELWGKGNINDIKPLHFDEHNGAEGLAHYFLKQPLKGSNAYSCSRNLKQPEHRTYTDRLRKRELADIVRYNDITALLRLYPENEYQIIEYQKAYNEVNGYYYFHLKIIKLTQKRKTALRSGMKPLRSRKY